MPLNAGQLTERVTLQQREDATVDANGQPSADWEDVATVWAKAEPLRGREFFAAGQTQSQVDVRFTIRWRDGVVPTMRVMWRGVAHDLVAVIEPHAGREALELMCVTNGRDTKS